MRSTLPLALLGLTLLATSCSSSATKASTLSEPGSMRDERGWLLPSKQLAQRIEIRANEADFVQNLMQFNELTEWFYSTGEPAYSTLLDLAASKSSKSSQVGMASIAMIGDRRLLEPFKQRVAEPPKSEEAARYAWGRALLAMNDLSGVPILIEGLEHEQPMVRRQIASELYKYVRDTGIQFPADGTPEERAQAISAWRAWYERMAAERASGGPQP